MKSPFDSFLCVFSVSVETPVTSLVQTELNFTKHGQNSCCHSFNGSNIQVLCLPLGVFKGQHINVI